MISTTFCFECSDETCRFSFTHIFFLNSNNIYGSYHQTTGRFHVNKKIYVAFWFARHFSTCKYNLKITINNYLQLILLSTDSSNFGWLPFQHAIYTTNLPQYNSTSQTNLYRSLFCFITFVLTAESMLYRKNFAEYPSLIPSQSPATVSVDRPNKRVQYLWTWLRTYATRTVIPVTRQQRCTSGSTVRPQSWLLRDTTLRHGQWIQTIARSCDPGKLIVNGDSEI